MSRFIFCILFFSGMVFNLHAQSKSLQCLFIPEESVESDEASQKATADTVNGVYLIPTVFHIIYHDSADKIFDNQVLDGLQLANLDFRLQTPDTVDIIAPFKSLAADSKIELRLAQIDPQGNPTNGITKTYSDSLKFDNLWDAYSDLTGGVNAWPTNKYLNIWVVKEFAGITSGGRGSSPSNLFPERQGIIITNNQIGSIGTGMGSRIFTHECGHFFNLFHLWAYLGTPGDTANCSKDDGVTDTPNCFGSSIIYGNPSGLWAESCGSLDNVQNYMDYSGFLAPRMFTEGQADRMHQALNSSLGARDNLHTLSNLIETGICQPVSVAEQLYDSILLYPNPASRLLRIRHKSFTLESVNIFDISGKVAKTIQNPENAIDISGLEAGMYFLQIQTDAGVLYKTLIKQ